MSNKYNQKQRLIENKILQYVEKLIKVNHEINVNLKCYGKPSVYWNQEELYTKQKLIQEFIEELKELKC